MAPTRPLVHGCESSAWMVQCSGSSAPHKRHNLPISDCRGCDGLHASGSLIFRILRSVNCAVNANAHLSDKAVVYQQQVVRAWDPAICVRRKDPPADSI